MEETLYATVKKITEELSKEQAGLLISNTLDEDDIENFVKNIIYQKDYKLLQFFIDIGFDVNKQLFGDESLMDFIIRNGDLKTAKIVVDNGIKFKKRGDIAYTSIIYAVQEDRLDILKLLVEHGADPNAEEDRGRTFDIFTFIEQNKNKQFFDYVHKIKDKFDPDKQKKIDNLRLRMIFDDSKSDKKGKYRRSKI